MDSVGSEFTVMISDAAEKTMEAFHSWGRKEFAAEGTSGITSPTRMEKLRDSLRIFQRLAGMEEEESSCSKQTKLDMCFFILDDRCLHRCDGYGEFGSCRGRNRICKFKAPLFFQLSTVSAGSPLQVLWRGLSNFDLPAACVIFNLAFLCHEQGTQQRDTVLLSKAACLYEKAIETLQRHFEQDAISDGFEGRKLVVLFMAISSTNLAHALLSLGNQSLALEWIQWSTQIVQGEVTRNAEQNDNLFLNSLLHRALGNMRLHDAASARQTKTAPAA